MSAIQPKITPLLLSESEAAAVIGVSPAYLYRLRAKLIPASQNPPPPPPYIMLGKRFKYRPADLQAWIDGMAEGSVRAVKRGRPTKAETQRRLAA
ncbi:MULTISPECIES: helix-turn-helix transcriptional regulator [Acetobacter]|uniref:helix-turn-helix transcriptional regulator n=1 Tax=Acetobacter TaxID=434 RepID=UPI00376F9395